MKNIRNEISKKNKYYISKDKYLELKHFCLQYREWKEEYLAIKSFPSRKVDIITDHCGMSKESFVENQAILAAELSKKMRLVEDICNEADEFLGNYIFDAVTKDLSFVNLQTLYQIPCSRDMYYDRYRKFFWLLSKER